MRFLVSMPPPRSRYFPTKRNIIAGVEKSTPTELEFLQPEAWQSWGALMMLHRSVLQRLDADLRRHHGLAVTEFDVLITLYNAPQKRLGMSALAERVLLSPAGVTHLVTRL